MFPKVAPKVAKAVFTWKCSISKRPRKSPNIMAIFAWNICRRQELLKIAESGHTDSNGNLSQYWSPFWTKADIFLSRFFFFHSEAGGRIF